MKSLILLAAAVALLAPTSSQAAAACAQKKNDTGFNCLKLKTQSDCQNYKQKINGTIQPACNWWPHIEKGQRAPKVATKTACQFCGDPASLTAYSDNNGGYFAIYGASSDLKAGAKCPAGWIAFAANDWASGKTQDEAIKSAKANNVCK